MALKDPHPPTPSPKAGEGEQEHKTKSLAPSPLVGEGWGEGYPRYHSMPNASRINGRSSWGRARNIRLS
jgi:hypothetical protein